MMRICTGWSVSGNESIAGTFEKRNIAILTQGLSEGIPVTFGESCPVVRTGIFPQLDSLDKMILSHLI